MNFKRMLCREVMMPAMFVARGDSIPVDPHTTYWCKQLQELIFFLLPQQLNSLMVVSEGGAV